MFTAIVWSDFVAPNSIKNGVLLRRYCFRNHLLVQIPLIGSQVIDGAWLRVDHASIGIKRILDQPYVLLACHDGDAVPQIKHEARGSRIRDAL